jgi:hypothetical protein
VTAPALSAAVDLITAQLVTMQIPSDPSPCRERPKFRAGGPNSPEPLHYHSPLGGLHGNSARLPGSTGQNSSTPSRA